MPGTNHSRLLPRVNCRPETSQAGSRPDERRRHGGAASRSDCECGAYFKLFAAQHRPAGAMPARRIAMAVIVAVVASLAGVTSAVQAQLPETLIHKKFVTVGQYHINLDKISYVKQGQEANGRTQVELHFQGLNEAGLMLNGADAETFLGFTFGKAGTEQTVRTSAKAEADTAPEPFMFRALDTFDGKLGLNWKPVRPEPSHVSLTKTPGALTITTQRGSIHGEETKDEFGAGVKARNLYLIDNPLAKGGDFVATTCVSGFTPETTYQQAGLIVYNDDDNYLKFGYEFNWPNPGKGQAFCILTETDAKSDFKYLDSDHAGLNRYWVRLTKRGNRYEYAISTDGKAFTVHGEVEWGDGSPQQIGLLAKNGGNKDASELDAAFEFFEFRAPVPGPPFTPAPPK
jgi:regulation of enolase protein 1 (concanavalin A-like superfamily)